MLNVVIILITSLITNVSNFKGSHFYKNDYGQLKIIKIVLIVN